MNKSPPLTTTNSILTALTVLTLTAFVLVGFGGRPFLSIALRFAPSAHRLNLDG
jgi:hypothetical protein